MNVCINNAMYDIEYCKLSGNILLFGEACVILIYEGYKQLREDAIRACGRYERGYRGEELEYSNVDVDEYIVTNIKDFCKDNFSRGIVDEQ